MQDLTALYIVVLFCLVLNNFCHTLLAHPQMLRCLTHTGVGVSPIQVLVSHPYRCWCLTHTGVGVSPIQVLASHSYRCLCFTHTPNEVALIELSKREEGVLGAAVNTISGKVDNINEHIDQVMEDAPTKLQVSVNVSDADWQKMQELHNQWMEQEKQMLADQYKQQETLWRKQGHRLTDIVRNNEGVWLSQRLFYIVGSLSLLSIITIVLEIAFYVYFH